MTNLEKMNELVGSTAKKEQIKNWAYMNRILVCGLADEKEFSAMERSVTTFMESEFYQQSDDELLIWDAFLKADFVQ